MVSVRDNKKPRPQRLPWRITTRVDFERDGKQAGYLNVPHSRNDSAWGFIQLPVTVIKNGEGPTILFTAGSHGDEYEGQIALMKLARALEPEEVSGRVIIVPALNLPAVRSASRLSPIDGLNMNRVFPGSRDGTITQMIAHYIHDALLPLADVVVDIHSGGKTLDFVPSAIMHELEDEDLRARTMKALLAFGAPVGLVLHELDSEGMLDTAVEEAGKVFLSTELGGAGVATANTVAIADRGVRNLLRHFGVIEGDPVRPEDDGGEATRLMCTPDAESFVLAEDNGIFEILADLGSEVEAGQPVGRIHAFESPAAPPSVYYAERSGLVLCRHAPGLIQKGDCMIMIGSDYDPEEPMDDGSGDGAANHGLSWRGDTTETGEE